MRCNLRIFSGYVCHLEQIHAQSPFLFPIFFGINTSPIWSGGNTTELTKREEAFSCSIGISLTKLENRFAYHTLVLFFKIKLGIAPLYLRSLLPTLSSSRSGYNFRCLILYLRYKDLPGSKVLFLDPSACGTIFLYLSKS